MELFQASRQWSTRPADERFSSLHQMHEKTKEYADAARTKHVPWSDLRVGDVSGDLALIGKAGVPATLTYYAFGQLCGRVSAPASYLRDLPATLAAQNLNHGLKVRDGGDAQLLFHQNGSLVLRAVTSEQYERVWNYEIIARLMDLSDRHALIPAEKTMEWSGGAVDVGTARDKALYASDHDMFAFLMSKDRAVEDPMHQAMRRGIIVTNSEVGDRSLGIMGFWFRDVCANHIIWGAQELATVSLRHVGDIRARWLNATVAVRKYLDADTSFETARFASVTKRIAGTKDEVLDLLFGRRVLPRVRLEEAYAAVVVDEDGDPRTAWGIAQGITRIAQARPYADERTELDRAATKVLEMSF